MLYSYSYHPLLKGFAEVIKKHFHLLHMNDEVKKAFTPGPMVSFQERQKLSSYLVRANPLERSVGSFKCNGKHCQVCINLTESNTFSGSVARKSMLLIIVLTAMTNALYICSLVISAKCNMQARLSMTFVFDGIISKIIIGNTLEKNHV